MKDYRYDGQKGGFVIVDGCFLLFRMFYGVQAKIRSKEGVLLNAVLGFIGAVIKYARLFQPQYLLVVFDKEQRNARCDIDADYKANRDSFAEVGDDDNPFCQLPIICQMLDLLGIKHFESSDGYECDDVIAHYISAYPDIYKIVVTGDADMLQLVSDDTVVFRDRGRLSVILDADLIRQRFGVPACRVIDVKCLVGDGADNIKGLHGVGIVTASNLINKYGGVEDIIAAVDSVTPPWLAQKIKDGSEILRKNHRLITLNVTAPIKYELSALNIDYKGFADKKTVDLLKQAQYL